MQTEFLDYNGSPLKEDFYEFIDTAIPLYLRKDPSSICWFAECFPDSRVRAISSMTQSKNLRPINLSELIEKIKWLKIKKNEIENEKCN